MTEEQKVALYELKWESVKNTGICDAPEMVVAEVGGGRIFAGTVWDHNGDGPQGWSMVFVPDELA